MIVKQTPAAVDTFSRRLMSESIWRDLKTCWRSTSDLPPRHALNGNNDVHRFTWASLKQNHCSSCRVSCSKVRNQKSESPDVNWACNHEPTSSSRESLHSKSARQKTERASSLWVSLLSWLTAAWISLRRSEASAVGSRRRLSGWSGLRGGDDWKRFLLVSPTRRMLLQKKMTMEESTESPLVHSL